MKLPLTAAVTSTAFLLAGAASADWTIKVHVETEEPVAFEHRSAENQPWELVCNAPCDGVVPVGDEFRFAETNDANETKPFGLKTEKPDANGVITVQHHKTSKSLYRAAPFVLIGSAAVFVTGIVLATVGITKAHGFLNDGSREQTNAVTGAGTLLIMAGLGGGYFGLSSRINNRYSDASGDVRSLEPVHGTGSSAPTRGVSILVPIFSGTF